MKVPLNKLDHDLLSMVESDENDEVITYSSSVHESTVSSLDSEYLSVKLDLNSPCVTGCSVVEVNVLEVYLGNFWS